MLIEVGAQLTQLLRWVQFGATTLNVVCLGKDAIATNGIEVSLVELIFECVGSHDRDCAAIGVVAIAPLRWDEQGRHGHLGVRGALAG